ncbi:MAG: hypothetical protein R2716_05355 [Microthrixaceae bacterium]
MSTDTRWSADCSRGFLFTDLYQLVMAQLYLADGIAQRRAQFDYFYRSNPDYGSHQAGFCVFAGLEPLLEWMTSVRVTDDELAELGAQRDPSGRPRFSGEFLEWLAGNGHFGDLELRAVPEGRGAPPGSDDHRYRAAGEGPAARDRTTQLLQLPDPGRHEGRSHRAGGR